MRGQTGKLIKLDKKNSAKINDKIRCTPHDNNNINKHIEINIVVNLKLK